MIQVKSPTAAQTPHREHTDLKGITFLHKEAE